MTERKKFKEKSPFKLRKRPLKDGRFSLFIDCFAKGKHEYEFLKLYLLPPDCEINKKENRTTLKRAFEIIKKKKEIFFCKRVNFIDKKNIAETTLSDFIDMLSDMYRLEGKKGYKHLLTAKNNLLKFKEGTKMKDIDRNFCREYTFWLKYEALTSKGKRLSPMTAHIYSRKLRVILENAVRMKYLDFNPWNLLNRREKIPEPEREQRFLTSEEVKRLESTPYKLPVIKDAFLFACFSGLRISDIIKLEWHEIDYRHNRFFLNITMKKTLKPLNVPLSSKAVNYLPYRHGDSNKVFQGLPGESQIQKHLKKFCASAGIQGRTHFHMSRHTFATLVLSAGVDLYTAGKLMGHSDIRSTQTYAKIIDSKKIEAINLIDTLLNSETEF